MPSRQHGPLDMCPNRQLRLLSGVVDNVGHGVFCHRVCARTDIFGTVYLILVCAHPWPIPHNGCAKVTQGLCSLKYIEAIAPHSQQTRPFGEEPLQRSCSQDIRDITEFNWGVVITTRCTLSWYHLVLWLSARWPLRVSAVAVLFVATLL